MNNVAPFTGAWIETIFSGRNRWQCNVAPFTGAWIETSDAVPNGICSGGRTLHGCVD